MGKSTRKPGPDHFTKTFRSTMETAAWRALSSRAQNLYPWVKLEWRGPKANNNGKIQLSVRQAAAAIGCNPKTAALAFHDLQAKGFLVQTEQAHLGLSGSAKSASYEITEIAMPQSTAPRHLYRDWKPGFDYPVVTAAANNPTGKNGGNKRQSKIVPLRTPKRD